MGRFCHHCSFYCNPSFTFVRELSPIQSRKPPAVIVSITSFWLGKDPKLSSWVKKLEVPSWSLVMAVLLSMGERVSLTVVKRKKTPKKISIRPKGFTVCVLVLNILNSTLWFASSTSHFPSCDVDILPSVVDSAPQEIWPSPSFCPLKVGRWYDSFVS